MLTTHLAARRLGELFAMATRERDVEDEAHCVCEKMEKQSGLVRDDTGDSSFTVLC